MVAEQDGQWRTILVLIDVPEEYVASILPVARSRATVGYSVDVAETCARIEQTVLALARRRDSPADFDDGTVIPRFGGTNKIRCRSLRCTWKPTSEFDRLPELTFGLRDGLWYVVCDACGSTADGPYRPADARELAAMVRVNNLWAPGDPGR